MTAPTFHSQRLYLSCARDEHAEDAARLAEALQQRGHMVWFDQTELREGANWEQAIEQGIASCDWFILLMTPHSVHQPTSPGTLLN